MKLITPILLSMESFSFHGQKELNNGTKLFGKAPHVGAEAYLHGVYPALDKNDIDFLAQRIHREIPKNLAQLYSEANGFSYFIDTFTVFGLRKNSSRDIEAVLSQPYDLLEPNTIERISGAEDDMVFFASYDCDGSLLYVRKNDERVFFCSSDSTAPIKIWSSMSEMLSVEADRIKILFDSDGVEIDSSVSTSPICSH
ncbi:hypothetical protein AGMMS49545_23550 [Betaproteobacteria bacterium]|nr:hypothetical protein AGMMS49545_23550 [Betaproteobacteria bacterium]GHU48767.1 hypothetical protein AGMMS50289_25680 [Betaproteobacteria bacterium]